MTIEWPLPKRVGFRFLFAYLVLYSFPFPADYIPVVGAWLVRPYMAMWKVVLPWVGKSVFHADATLATTGSGDMTWNWVQFVCMLAMAAMAAVIWSVLDRKRTDYVQLYRYLHAYVRLVLASSMFVYGIAKLIPPTQFPAPALDRLVETYGASSPMGILWTFMGASMGYSMLSGAAETLAATLLIFRRTALLGALVAAGVLANIVALNFFYDVPVKLYSLHLLMMAVFVAAPDLGRLFDFLVRRPDPLFEKRWAHLGALVFRSLLACFFVYLAASEALSGYREFFGGDARSPLRGIWNVEVLDVDGVPRPPLVTDATRWRRVVFDYPPQSSVYLMSDERVRYNTKLDAKAKTIKFTNRFDPKETFSLAYQRPDSTTLQLDGMVAGKKLHAVCKLADDKNFLLMTRGFHWISERPFNR